MLLDNGPRCGLKILGVIPSLTRGGAERALSLLTHDWAKCHDVVVAAFDASRPAYAYHARIVDLGLILPGRSLARVHVACASTLLLMKLFLAERPDRIITFMEPANFPAILAAAIVGALDRLVVSVRQNPNMLPSARRLLIPRLYRLPAAVVAVSDGVRRALVAMGLPVERVTTIPQPRITSQYHPSRLRPARSRPVRASCRAVDSCEGVRYAGERICPCTTPQSPTRGAG